MNDCSAGGALLRSPVKRLNIMLQSCTLNILSNHFHEHLRFARCHFILSNMSPCAMSDSSSLCFFLMLPQILL